jgi:hypothetical protein
VDNGVLVNAHIAAFTYRFDKKRKFEFGGEGFLSGDEFLKRGNGQAIVAPDAFGEGFIEGDGVG